MHSRSPGIHRHLTKPQSIRPWNISPRRESMSKLGLHIYFGAIGEVTFHSLRRFLNAHGSSEKFAILDSEFVSIFIDGMNDNVPF